MPRQVTGFTPGTFELIKKGRIAGFIIGATQMQQFRQSQPDATFMLTSDFVNDGENYIASRRRSAENKDTIVPYLQAVRGSMQQIIADKPSDYADTIKKLRAKYDFAELEDDAGRELVDRLPRHVVDEGRQGASCSRRTRRRGTADLRRGGRRSRPRRRGVDVSKNLRVAV